MRGNWWIWLIVLLAALAICGWLWTELSGCRDDLERCEQELEECCGSGPPTGGPDIDITIGGGGKASYSVDGAPAPPNASGTLDRNFFSKRDRISLIDTAVPAAWIVPDVKVYFSDGSRVEAIPDPANSNALVWKCYDAGNNPTTLAPGAAGSGVPACMDKVVQGGKFSYTSPSGGISGNWFHVTTFQ